MAAILPRPQCVNWLHGPAWVPQISSMLPVLEVCTSPPVQGRRLWKRTGNFLLIFLQHDDVIKWKHFLRYWQFVQGIHRSPVNSLHKGQWRGALMFSFICAWINGWINNREAGDLRCHRTHYDIIVMISCLGCEIQGMRAYIFLLSFKHCMLPVLILASSTQRNIIYFEWQ